MYKNHKSTLPIFFFFFFFFFFFHPFICIIIIFIIIIINIIINIIIIIIIIICPGHNSRNAKGKYYMHNQEIPWFLPDIKLVFSLFSKKKYVLLAGEINLVNRNYFL